MAVTLKDVAKRAGVSYATVSRVVGGKPNIHPDTVERVRSAIDELQYKPNRTARSLRARQSKIIGVIVSDIRYDFFPPVVRAVEDLASAAGFAVLLCNSDERLEKEARYVDLLLEENVSGAVIAPTGRESRAIGRLLEAGVPVSLLDRTVPDVQTDNVVVDNFDAAYRATLHLYDNGYRRIGAIVGSDNATTAEQRYLGFQRAVEERSSKVAASLVRRGLPYFETGEQAMHELLTVDQPPDAVFVSNHLLAAGALKALDRLGLRTAEDIGLVTFDDPAWASLVSPAVTAVSQPAYRIGEEAVRALLERIDGFAGAPRRIVLETELVVRGSSRGRPDASAHTRSGREVEP